MSDFSATDAIGAGFRVVARAPLALLAWTAVYFVLGVLPIYWVMADGVPNIVAFYQAQARMVFYHAPPDLAAMRDLSAHLMGLQPVLWLSAIISRTLVVGAIFRAVLRPQDRAFLYLRLSAQELWLGLSGLVLGVVMFILVIVVMIPVIIAAVVADGALRHGGASEGGGVSGFVVMVIALVGLAAILWLALRLSMAPVMSFAQGRFAFYESWSLTEGHALKMFAVALAMIVVSILLSVVVAALGAGAGLAAVSGDWRSLLIDSPDVVARRLLPAFIAFSLVASVLGMAFFAILAAPWASIYSQLAGDAPAIEG